MRVGLLTWAYPPEASGLANAAAEIAHALADAGAGVRVLTMDRRGRGRDGPVEWIGCAVAEGSLAARLRRRPAIGHVVGPWAFWRALGREHRHAPFDLVEATNWYAPAAIAAQAGPVPVIVRNSTPAAISAADAPGLAARFDRRAAMLLERVTARASAGLISNTRAHGETIAALYGVAAPSALHAVIGLSLPDALARRGAAAPYPEAGPVELLFVGRAEHRKGFDALCAAIERVAADRTRLPDARITLVGVAEEDLALSADARRLVRRFDRIGEAELHELLAAAHVVVAPSRYESFGLVYQEAMAFGRPLIACAEDASARHFVGESGAGLLIPSCDGAELAAAMRRLIVDPGLRTRLAAASRTAAGRFTRAGLARETLALYRSAIGSKRRSSRSSSCGRPAPADIAS